MKSHIHINGYDLDPSIILGVGPIYIYDPQQGGNGSLSGYWNYVIDLHLVTGKERLSLGKDKLMAETSRSILIRKIWPGANL